MMHFGSMVAHPASLQNRSARHASDREHPLAAAFDPSMFSAMSGLKAPRAPHLSTPEELSAFAHADEQNKPMLIWRDGEGRQQILLLEEARR